MYWPRWIFLRLLGFGFLFSFLSLLGQVEGLIGPRGILPVNEYLDAVYHQLGGWSGFLHAPSLLWIGSGPLALKLLCLGGALAGGLLFFNLWPKPAVFLCWLLYLSYVSPARNFSGFQSDGLMLETALLAVFLAPRGMRPGLGGRSPPSRAVVLLFWWLCFRLIFEPGIAKSTGGDVAWRTFTALEDYYVNCPFPTWVGWYVQQMPAWFHAALTGAVLYIEVMGAFLIFMGRKGRAALFVLWAGMHLGILLTANYTFLNYNSIGIALLLLDDKTIRRVLRFLRPPDTGLAAKAAPWWRRVGAGLVLVPVFYTGLYIFLAVIRVPVNALPEFTQWPVSKLGQFRSANRYALFGAMTHHRYHIEFDGTNDHGRTWKTYRYKWQAQDVKEAPRFMAPHLPRFDWNLWFAQLSSYQNARHRFVLVAGTRLLDGEPAVIELFAENPFPDDPPAIIRFKLYRYGFTGLETKKETGEWWVRTDIGYWAPYVYRDSVDGTFKLSLNFSNIPEKPKKADQ